MSRSCLLTLSLCVLLAASAWAGGEAEGTGAATGPQVTAPGTFPVVEEMTTVSALVGGHRLVENLETNEFTARYEEKTNVHFEFDIAPYGQWAEKRNLVLASGDLPDIFMYVGINATQMVAYGSQGLFHPLQGLIAEHSVHLKKLMEEKPYIAQDLTAPDGNIYALPQGAECFHCSAPRKMWIYQPWLDSLGLEMPETTEDFLEVLTAFKDGDPNGNGQADEIPLAGYIGGALNHFLISAFEYWDGSLLKIEDGTIRFVADSEAFRDGVRYMKQLHDAGVLAPESFTMDNKQLKQLGENPDVEILGAAPALWYGVFATNFGPSGRFLNWRAVPPLTGPSGLKVAVTAPFRVQPHTLVSHVYDHPEVIVRWADWLYSMEGNRDANVGVEGQDWRRAKPGEVNYNGNPAMFFVEPHVKYAMQNQRWLHIGPHFNSRELRQGGATTPEIMEKGQERRLYQWTDEFYHPYKYAEFMPNLIFGEAVALELGQIEPALQDAVESAIARFVTGNLSIDDDWDGYLRELEGLERDRYVELYQQALDAKRAATQ